MALFGAVPVASPHNPNKSFEVTAPPTDGISSLSFNPIANYLVATSWDNQVRCWEIQANGQSMPRTFAKHDQPVLCSCWKSDGQAVFSGGCDKQVKAWDIFSGTPPVTVGSHDAPVKDISWISELNLLVTSSWDKTIRYWDLRSNNAVHTQQLPERAYAMSVKYPLMVVATADRHIVIYNLQNPQVGSIEGRVAVQYIDDAQSSKNFTFKCHRDGNDIYAVNSINFHPVHGTFSTAGSDGAFHFWDKDNKQRLKPFQRCDQPIPCTTFNHDGTILAYAVGYDWSKGAAAYNAATAKNHILLHPVEEADVKPKAKQATPGKR